jgi:hypothetical protein
MRIPNMPSSRGVQWQQDYDLVKDSPKHYISVQKGAPRVSRGPLQACRRSVRAEVGLGVKRSCAAGVRSLG